MFNRMLTALAVVASTTLPAWAQQGVSANEIVIGSIQDLSGPIAAIGKQMRSGMMLRVDEINEQGGVQGRKLRLQVEDSGYDPKRATLAAEKLVNRDKIFAMVGHVGTAHNMAAMPVQFEKNVINFFPLTGAREMYEPVHRLKYALLSSYHDQMAEGVQRLVREKAAKRLCVHYQDDEAGQEIVRGAEAGAKAVGLELIERTSFKRGSTDFSTQVSKLQAANCDFVALGTIIRETIGTLQAAQRAGFKPVFLVTFAAYSELIPKLGGAAVNGLYATMTIQFPYLDDASKPIQFWATKYKTKFNEDPTVYSAYGYVMIDAFAQAAGKAGKTLTTDSFVKAMDSIELSADIFGSPAQTFSPTKRLGNSDSRLSQIQDGRWRVVSDYTARAGVARNEQGAKKK
jgi:branched-chain amino acid transport system substrate-binding protein